MGPWFFHDDAVPFRPGCSYETLRKLIAKKRVTGETIIRGPGTNQFWVYARHAPGVAHLMGVCHNCGRQAGEDAFMCEHCGAAFPAFEDRQMLGLAPVRLLPGQAKPSHVAASALNADPDESNYGPVAPTFAIAAVEAAASAASRPNPGETIDDETPATTSAISNRRDRRYGRMKMTVGFMAIVIIALLVAVAALLMQSGALGGATATTATSEPIPAPVETTPPADPAPTMAEAMQWSQRLAEADSLVATDDPDQMQAGLVILHDVQANAPSASIPEDLQARIDRLAEAIEAAKLRKYLNRQD